MGKLSISFEWLSGCSGCEVGTVDLHDRLLRLLEDAEIVRLPILMDCKGYPEADLGIVTGALRTEHDIECLRAMRASCQRLLALGVCSVYGGPQGAGEAHTLDQIIDTVFRANPTTTTNFVPERGLPRLLASGVRPIDTEVQVDLYLPGCPPSPYYIAHALLAVAAAQVPEFGSHNVCFRCKRKMRHSEAASLRRLHEIDPDAEACWLSQGVLCMGSATLDRCLAPCPQRGLPCTGCSGPSEHVILEPARDVRTEVADRMSRMTRIPRERIIQEIERQAKTYYAYAMASPVFRGKPTFLLQRWIAS